MRACLCWSYGSLYVKPFGPFAVTLMMKGYGKDPGDVVCIEQGYDVRVDGSIAVIKHKRNDAS